MNEAAISLRGLCKWFGPASPMPSQMFALDHIEANIPAGFIAGVVGPDGAGKTTLMRLLAGLMSPSAGEALVLGLPAVSPSGGSQPFVGYMPQKFGLYEDLSVFDNLKLHARLRDITGDRRDALFAKLLDFTDLHRFTGRLAGKLSGGMKQKLGLACALIGTPRVLLLDEPGVGVDPQSRRELWRMVNDLAVDGMTVVWSTAYMDEAERCDSVLMLDSGRLLHAGPPGEFLKQVTGRTFFLSRQGSQSAVDILNSPAAQDHLKGTEPDTAQGAAMDAAWVRAVWQKWSADPRTTDMQAQGSSLRLLLTPDAVPEPDFTAAPPRLEDAYMNAVGGIGKTPSPFLSFPAVLTGSSNAPVIHAKGLTKRFGEFTAAQDISFDVAPGRIFGLLGPNGAGKSTTFRMLCGLLRPTAGECSVAGVNLMVSPGQARGRLGYMAQKFSLYGDLSVEQNIRLFADLYGMPQAQARERSRMLLEAFQLDRYLTMPAQDMPLGQKQRLALLCATLHGPAALFLDEPTSGVDPRTRREFWKHINALTSIGVAVLVTTHFMEEAEYCDELALIYRGVAIAKGTPDSLKKAYRTPTLPDPTMEDAFIACIDSYHKEHHQ